MRRNRIGLRWCNGRKRKNLKEEQEAALGGGGRGARSGPFYVLMSLKIVYLIEYFVLNSFLGSFCSRIKDFFFFFSFLALIF